MWLVLGLLDIRGTGAHGALQDLDYFASVIWLIMRGDPITQEFLAALTASQVCTFLLSLPLPCSPTTPEPPPPPSVL